MSVMAEDLEGTRTTIWNLPGPSGTGDSINIVNLSHLSPSSVGANTDVIHNQRQKTLKVASDCFITRHFTYTVYITLLMGQTCMFMARL